ncbi:hypothetical protein TNIN_70871 [Trichonephila inaurata madagascariensis]|uniref:Uncharacterized protein n=1 Tax=Trichonephila inaurata madagascariensis TaxID=2747483 RepID=A0A8X7BWM2_9ARAC|nr:hypothetical protein TNIN_70871 [Trichonephila inaurata madagascariensis]
MSTTSNIDVENLPLEPYFENLEVPRDYSPPPDIFPNFPSLPVPTPPQTIQPRPRRSLSEGYSSGSSPGSRSSSASSQNRLATRNRSKSPAAARNRSRSHLATIG